MYTSILARSNLKVDIDFCEKIPKNIYFYLTTIKQEDYINNYRIKMFLKLCFYFGKIKFENPINMKIIRNLLLIQMAHNVPAVYEVGGGI
jgi:hypothetical protein